jgi:hypothetical protein
MTSDPDQIREQIEETRSGLSQDVNTLADTVNPDQAAKRTAASARSAVLGAKDKVMGAASQSVSGTSSAAGTGMAGTREKLMDQASGNPLAVGLIAVGVGWLLGSLLPASSAEEHAAVKVKEAATPALADSAKDVASSLQDSAQHAADSVKATAVDAAAMVKDEAASSAHDVQNQAQTARDTVADTPH